MNIILKQLRSEMFVYHSDKPVTDLKTEIDALFKKTDQWNNSVNLKGKFISESEFKVTPKWQLFQKKGKDDYVVILKGNIVRDEFGRAQVNLEVIPNAIFAFFFFLFPVLAVIMMVLGFLGQKNEALISSGLYNFLIPPFMLLVSAVSKRRLRNRFAKALSLSQ